MRPLDQGSAAGGRSPLNKDYSNPLVNGGYQL